jgi:DNA adenine methylase
MQYLGGKTRIAKQIVAQLPDAKCVWEPFCGGLNMTLELAKRYEFVGASDLHPGPIALGQALKDGWQPPIEVSREDWYAAKLLPDTDPRKAFIGFGCSFGGKWFGGYAKDDPAHGSYFAGACGAFCERLRPLTTRIAFARLDFMTQTPQPGIPLIYCDPPYAGTTGYETGDWDPDAFWARCREWVAQGSRVFVSEYSGQGLLVWEGKPRKSSMNKGETGAVTVTERLYEVTL